MSAPAHRWGCLCVECAGRGRAQLREAQAVRRHNLAALTNRHVPEYYTSGPRVPHAGASLDRYHAYDWMTRPHPGELEYLK